MTTSGAQGEGAVDGPALDGAPLRILVVCTGNSARSQIAEALVEHRSAGTVEARSAGSHPKPLHPNAVRVMAERGVRVISDCLPPRVSRTDEYKQILELERKLGRRPEFAAIARYTHCLAHRAELVSVSPVSVSPVEKHGA